MPATVSVLYPRNTSSTFDLDYYISTHMPLCAKHWTKYGLKSWSVIQLGESDPYSIHCAMDWTSVEDFQKALGDEGTKAIMDDVPTFSNDKPVLMQGSVVGTS